MFSRQLRAEDDAVMLRAVGVIAFMVLSVACENLMTRSPIDSQDLDFPSATWRQGDDFKG
jgi:hypothetical protein